MRKTFMTSQFLLTPGLASAGRLTCAHTIKVSTGLVWITVEGKREDFWLRGGESLTIGPCRLMVMEAHGGPATISLAVAPTHNRPFQRFAIGLWLGVTRRA
jgi:hypothetical protein